MAKGKQAIVICPFNAIETGFNSGPMTLKDYVLFNLATAMRLELQISSICMIFIKKIFHRVPYWASFKELSAHWATKGAT